jgi:protein gp37
VAKTSIQWTDHSVNPIRARLGNAVGHHCVKVSPGCTNCYSSQLQSRFRMPRFEMGKRKDVEPFFDEKRLQEVLRRRIPTKWFWCDMSDLFGEWVPDEWIDRCFVTMAKTQQHIHQVLTKRPERMRDYCEARRLGLPLPNVWLGVSCEDQQRADERIPILLQTPAAVRFISAEPLLGPIDLVRSVNRLDWLDAASLKPGGLDWVIVGGESGPNARPCYVEWVRGIVEQCQAAGVPAFVKQLGAFVLWNGIQGGYGDRPSNIWPAATPLIKQTTGNTWAALRDRKGGNPSEWPADLRVREFPRTLVTA